MDNEKRIIRKVSLPDDGEAIMAVFAEAKAIMRSSGNASQWADNYPSLLTVQADIERNGSFVIEDDGLIVGYFAFLPSPEPTYDHIYDGAWLDDEQPYRVIHRIASTPRAHGIFRSIMDYCFAHEHNIRIDTHRNNRIMQHNIRKYGFLYCGIIHLANGDERLAYQRLKGVSTTIERYLEKPYWVIDILPKQVPADSQGQYLAVQDYFLRQPQFGLICQQFSRLLIKLSCYYDMSACTADSSDWTPRPQPESIASLLTSGKTVYFVIPSADAMIAFNGDDHYLTLYNPDASLLQFLSSLSAPEALYVWSPTDALP